MVDFGINSTYYFRPNMGFGSAIRSWPSRTWPWPNVKSLSMYLNPPIMNQDHGLYFQGVTAVSTSPGSSGPTAKQSGGLLHRWQAARSADWRSRSAVDLAAYGRSWRRNGPSGLKA